MRAVIQRVNSAEVSINNQKTASIGKGIVVFAGLAENDTKKDFEYIINKIINLRIFEDRKGLFDISVSDLNLEILIISQFTLYGDCRKGRRPSFTRSMAVDKAKEAFEIFIEMFKKSYPRVSCGVFQAMMDISLINNGPVTLILDSDKNFY